MQSSEGKGNILIATRPIKRGEVIFTEQAADAAQALVARPKCVSGESIARRHEVRACQNCFKSLEESSSLSKDSVIPHANLWPNFETSMVYCKTCDTSFCCQRCADIFLGKIGNCCLYCSVLDAMREGMSYNAFDSRLRERTEEVQEVDAILVLATRMFVAAFNNHRGLKHDHLFGGMCGDAGDINSLEIGHPTYGSSEEGDSYSLRNGYVKIVKVLELTDEEIAGPLSLSYFHTLAALAARNSIGFTTQSPFRSYYRALLRETGGRDTARHQIAMSELASVLGSKDGVLTRNMDRMIEEKVRLTITLPLFGRNLKQPDDNCHPCLKVAAEVGGIFTLAARMNHSCDPCAKIVGQEYVDCNIDCIALRQIKEGEEITISYLNLGSNPSYSVVAKDKRCRELRARYLFDCTCDKCAKIIQNLKCK